MMTIDQFEAKLGEKITTVRPWLEVGLDDIGKLAQSMAKSYIGSYQHGWAPLAESTIADKAAKGFAVPAPLLRTGEMRDSIEYEVELAEFEVVVGSHLLIALYQELGTSRIPPRSFLGLAMSECIPLAEEIFGKIAVKILTE